jgi:hypothetical protein
MFHSILIVGKIRDTARRRAAAQGNDKSATSKNALDSKSRTIPSRRFAGFGARSRADLALL